MRDGKLCRVSKTEILEELPKLKPEERQEIRAKLNELDQIGEETWIDDGELTAEEKTTLDERIAAYEKNPESGSSWSEVEARSRQKLQG